MNGMEHKTLVFCYIDVQEFHSGEKVSKKMCEKHSLEALKTRLFSDVLSQEQGTSTDKVPDFVQLECRRQQSEWYGLAILLTWHNFLLQYESTCHRACSQRGRTRLLYLETKPTNSKTQIRS
jgi:hypothetical protein